MPMSALGLLTAGIALAYAPSHPRFSQGLGALVVAIAAAAAVLSSVLESARRLGILGAGIVAQEGPLNSFCDLPAHLPKPAAKSH